MWEIIERMATDRLWIYTALVGAVYLVHCLLHTYVALELAFWTYGKWSALLDFPCQLDMGLDMATAMIQNAWRKLNPDPI